MVCSAGAGGFAPDREPRFGVTPLAASCRGGGNRGVRRADCRSASGVARRATLTRGCAEARLEHFSYRCRPEQGCGRSFLPGKAAHNSSRREHSNRKNALANLAQEPFAQCSPWDLAVAMVWQVAGAKNADAARRFARCPYSSRSLSSSAAPRCSSTSAAGIGTPATAAVLLAPEINELLKRQWQELGHFVFREPVISIR